MELQHFITAQVAEAFEACGFDKVYGQTETSNRPDLGQFQCNGALAAAKQYKTNPRQIAQQVVDVLKQSEVFSDVSLAGPGFINLTLTDNFLASHVAAMSKHEFLGCEKSSDALTVMIDYGGANIAKPLHVGHLRSAIIGECLKRLTRFLGHTVYGDVHLGDWGLQMGMIITELQERHPELPYFDETHAGPYPEESPVTVADLEEIYPDISGRAKEDSDLMQRCQQATFDLQHGRAGYRALWQHIHNVSIADLKNDYGKLDTEFDLWLGESDTQDRIPELLAQLKHKGLAYESQGALVVDISLPEDKKELPPILLRKSDGAALYGTTDLATIEQRVQDYAPDVILYVVDKRQSDHFRQVFRAAYKCAIAPESTLLEHVGFGTVNGPDGKPFKTRAGGVMKLKDLIAMITDKAAERMAEAELASDYDEDEKSEIARIVGVAALKFADLMNNPATNYVFDLDRFSSFDGRTGPYLLYTAVRIKSILRKAADQNLEPGELQAPASDVERTVLLKIAELPTLLNSAFEQRAPHYLCEYVYTLASLFTRFYHEHHILRETDRAQQASWLTLCHITLSVMEQVLSLLGIEIPERM